MSTSTLHHCTWPKIVHNAGYNRTCTTPYVLRRLTANAIDTTKIVEGSKLHALGHAAKSRATFLNRYMTKRTTIDIQGVILSGGEDHGSIAEHGLRKAISTALTPEELAEVQQHPRVQQHKLDAQMAKNACLTAN